MLSSLRNTLKLILKFSKMRFCKRLDGRSDDFKSVSNVRRQCFYVEKYFWNISIKSCQKKYCFLFKNFRVKHNKLFVRARNRLCMLWVSDTGKQFLKSTKILFSKQKTFFWNKKHCILVRCKFGREMILFRANV